MLKVMIIGNVGNEPEYKSEHGVVNFSVAHTEKWKSKSGEAQEKTEWVRVVGFGKLSEIVSKYVNKVDKLYVEGKLQTRKWTDSDGQERYTTEVVMNQMEMLGGTKASTPEDDDSGIPF